MSTQQRPLPVQQLFDDLYGTLRKPTLAGKVREITPILSIGRPAAEYVYETVRRLAPRSTVEVGMAWGFSSVAICAALRDAGGGVNHVIDPFQVQQYEGVGLAALAGYGLMAHARHYAERSDVFLPRFFAGHVADPATNRIQFGFIDGDHRIDAVFMDFYYVNKLLEEQGIVIFDDVQFPSIASVVSYALKNFHYERLPCAEVRYAVLRKTKDDDRGWGDYGSF